jgi:hypothetical protein
VKHLAVDEEANDGVEGHVHDVEPEREVSTGVPVVPSVREEEKCQLVQPLTHEIHEGMDYRCEDAIFRRPRVA